MILDEAAFIEGGQELWSACLASVSTGGKVYLISTPNGMDEIYYEAYEGSTNGTNKFKITAIKWWEDPRYNVGLKMVKTDDIINWIQKPEAEKKEEILSNIIPDDVKGVVKPDLYKRIMGLISQGYQPHSQWFENMCRDMNLNKRMINQELNCVIGETLVTIRNKSTGVIENIRIEELNSRL
jgi:phage FluMu gp28-like protein